MIIKSENAAHSANCLQAEHTRQITMATVTTQSAAVAADIAFYRSLLASAVANKCGTSAFASALKSLGVNS